MIRSADGVLRSPFATATAAIRITNPSGNSQSKLSHRVRPTRTRGAMPCAWGTEPAQVVGSTTSSPVVSCDRKLRTASGVTPEGALTTDRHQRSEQSSVRVQMSAGAVIAPVLLIEVDIFQDKRYMTAIGEFDRVMGGGIVLGSVTLIGGDPGIGKSTIVLQA